MTRASWFTFKRSSGSSAALPLYAIKGTYGVDDSSNPTPAVPSAPLPSLYFNLPASQSQQLAAYWMTMSGNRNGVILVGPKGWKATDATEGANGSFGITLVNPGHPGEQIKLSDSGGCQGCAIQSIGRYFPNLTQWANDSGFPAEFNNAITFHRSLSDNLMAYALKPDSTGLATNGVAYQEHAGGSAAFETETVSLPASSHALATTILNYFVQVHKINRGPVLSYAPHGSYFRTISTPLGTIWSPDPDMNWHSGGMRPYPTKDTAVYLSAPNQTSLDTSTAKQLFTIPAVAGIDAQKQDMYHYLGLLKTTGHWLVYSTYTSEPEMNQPFGNDLWMYDLKTGKSAKITSFLDAGGAFFNLALYKHEVFYQKGGFDAKGKKLAKTSVYDMSNGTTSLIPANEVNNLTVHAEVDGQSMQVRLQEE